LLGFADSLHDTVTSAQGSVNPVHRDNITFLLIRSSAHGERSIRHGERRQTLQIKRFAAIVTCNLLILQV
jgi:hypothetical protein